MLLAIHDWLPDILETQIENLEVLWGHWMDRRRSPDWSLAELRRLEGRIEAHVDGLVLAGERADAGLQAVMGQGFAASDLAAGYSMLRAGRSEPATAAASYFEEAEPAEREGIMMALALGPVEATRAALMEFASRDDEPLGAAAGRVLSTHGLPLPQPGRLSVWRRSADPTAARDGWWATAFLPRKDRAGLGFSEYRAAVEHESEDVREAAYVCAAVSGADWIVAYARDHALECAVALRWFAALAAPSDAAVFGKLLRTSSLGAARFEAAASYGHASVVDVLLDAMKSEDPLVAVPAGRAFTRITGQDIESLDRAAMVSPEQARTQDYDPDLVDEAYLPDPGRARAYWDKNAGKYSRGTRWLRGIDFADPASAIPPDLDLRSRFEESVRKHQTARIGSETRALERFPAG